MQPNPDQLRQFMDAIAEVESGGEEDPYRALGPTTGKWGTAQGRYQIMSRIWPGWAAEAGYGGLTEQQYLQSPEIQDKIAAHKMGQYYDRYDGRWDLVAAAWFGGPGAADEARDRGLEATANRNDGFNSVPQYVQKVLRNMPNGTSGANEEAFRQAEQQAYSPSQVQQQAQANITGGSESRQQDVTQPPERQIAQEAMQMMSQMVRQNPGSRETHAMVRKAMEQFVGKDTLGGTGAAVRDAGRTVTAAEKAPAQPPAPPSREVAPEGGPVPGQGGVMR